MKEGTAGSAGNPTEPQGKANNPRETGGTTRKIKARNKPQAKRPAKDPAMAAVPFDRRTREVIRMAESLYAQEPDWVTFFREILGVHGVVQRMYSEAEEMAEFERSEANARIQLMLTRLRERHTDLSHQREPQRMITVRLPASVHDALTVEAQNRHISMNQLCISKLLQMIDNERVPGAGKSAVAGNAGQPPDLNPDHAPQ